MFSMIKSNFSDLIFFKLKHERSLNLNLQGWDKKFDKNSENSEKLIFSLGVLRNNFQMQKIDTFLRLKIILGNYKQPILSNILLPKNFNLERLRDT